MSYLCNDVTILSNDVKKIEKKVHDTEQEKLEKKIKKLEEQLKEKRTFEKDLFLSYEMTLNDEFEIFFSNINNAELAKTKLLMLDYRKKIIRECGDNEVTYNYLEKNYEKILNNVYKKYKNDEMSKEYFMKANKEIERQKQLQELREKRKIEQPKQENINVFKNILYITQIICYSTIIFLKYLWEFIKAFSPFLILAGLYFFLKFAYTTYPM